MLGRQPESNGLVCRRPFRRGPHRAVPLVSRKPFLWVPVSGATLSEGDGKSQKKFAPQGSLWGTALFASALFAEFAPHSGRQVAAVQHVAGHLRQPFRGCGDAIFEGVVIENDEPLFAAYPAQPAAGQQVAFAPAQRVLLTDRDALLASEIEKTGENLFALHPQRPASLGRLANSKIWRRVFESNPSKRRPVSI